MAKVSKTIKKLRTARGFTQDALAEKLFVTRQTVSSWENDRTQPDIETLKMISDIFEVSLEEIIYGEKRKTDPNAENAKARKILTIVFAVLASALIGVGLILIFVTGWKKFPVPLKTVFAFVPMLAGQAAVIYTHKKHRKSLPWREGAAVLLCAGIAGTVAMADSIFDLSTTFVDCMFIDALMILPVIYLFDVAAPLIFYYVSLLYFASDYILSYPTVPVMLITAALYAFGFGYVILNRKKTDDFRHICTLWISAAAAVVLTFIFSENYTASYTAMLALSCLGLYALDKKDYRFFPFRTLGTLGIAASSAIALFVWEPTTYRSGYEFNIPRIALSICVVIAAVICTIIGRKSFKKDITKIAYCASAFLSAAIQMLTYKTASHGKTSVYILLFALAFVQAITLVVKGIMELKFMPLNAGLILIGVLIANIVIGFDIGLFYTGVLFVLMGIVLFLANFLIARKVKAEKEADVHA